MGCAPVVREESPASRSRAPPRHYGRHWEWHDDEAFTVTMVDVRLSECPAGNTNCYICNTKEGLHGSATASLQRPSMVSGVRSTRGRLQENRAVLPVARSAITGIAIEMFQWQSPTGWDSAWLVAGRYERESETIDSRSVRKGDIGRLTDPSQGSRIENDEVIGAFARRLFGTTSGARSRARCRSASRNMQPMRLSRECANVLDPDRTRALN